MARRIKRMPDEVPILFQMAEEIKNSSFVEIREEEPVQNPTKNESVLKIGATFEYDGCTFEVIEINGDTVKTKEINISNAIGIAFDNTVSKEFAIEQIKNTKVKTKVNVSFSESKETKTVESLLAKCAAASNNDKPETLFSNGSVEKVDFTLDNDFQCKSKKKRVEDNINAIRLLKTIKSENRRANESEQIVLSHFSGWGGLLDFFDSGKTSGKELKTLLSDTEYKNAKSSALTAFYTPIRLIKLIWKRIRSFGFKGGRILDPACGTARFYQAMPADIKNNSSLFGIELEKISAELASNLIQSARIKHCGFEETHYINDTYDLVITNVPFGEYGVNDSKYNKYNFKIHDYFFAKSIDLVRPGGLVVAITSHFTMDKKNSKIRKYLAQRAEFLGAVRLPNDFFESTHTNVVSDVLFLKKRESLIADINEQWITISQDESIPLVNPKDNSVMYPIINDYFIAHKDNIVGDYVLESTQYGYSPTVASNEYCDKHLEKALENITDFYEAKNTICVNSEKSAISVPEELLESINFSYVLYEDTLYYRNNDVLELYQAKNKTAEKRIRNAILVRDVLIQLMAAMLSNKENSVIEELQFKLNNLYEDYVDEYGRFNSRVNALALREDVKYPLLCSLEVYNEDNEFIRKADIFNKRTIKPYTEPHADNAEDAFNVSIAKFGRIDFDFMSNLTGIDKKQLQSELERTNAIFTDPSTEQVVPADEYLSGYVCDKLNYAKRAAQKDKSYQRNVEALEKVQPQKLNYNEIFVSLGTNWIKAEYYEEFIYHTFKTPSYNKSQIQVRYVAGKYYISNKKSDYSVNNLTVYGTPDVTGLELLEDALNFINTRIYDKVTDENGHDKYVVNPQKSQVAQSKQEMLRQAFNDWIWQDFNRRQDLVETYNNLMNNIVEREYDGNRLTLQGMSSSITLKAHQKTAVARGVFGGNTLLAHTMGAGKTFEIIAIAMESKRLGLCSKSMIVVPNHLVSQWASEFLRLYPFANVLVSTKRDFEKNNRKKFLCKIATGDFDAVIISYSQFKKIPLSTQKQMEFYENEINEAERLLDDVDVVFEDCNINMKQYTKRQYEIKIKQLKKKIECMMEIEHDDVITFEELGCDRLFVDEAHNYKNLAINTKINNVAGLQNANSQRAYDLLMKVRYINELTNYSGVIFATGTPVSNAICELYVLQKYLQEQDLKKQGINSFDEWVGRFAETESKIEVMPEGTGYRTVVRLCKYHNLPELMRLFRKVADIKPIGSIELDVPETENINVAVEPSQIQVNIVKHFAERAKAIRDGNVDSTVDNMLCVTNDGRKLAIDQRLYNPNLEDDETSKLNECIRNIYNIWSEYADARSTQLVFCDMSTPKKDCFNVYDDIKSKLVQKGVPSSEIEFIHNAKTDEQKKTLYDNMNAGNVRVLIGSTEKLGAGTNVQKRLIALHNIDCPWRPSDLDQRNGRIVRPGNDNKKVFIFNYVTKNTFDTYLYQTVETKARFISQIMTAKIPQRDMEDIDCNCLNYAEIKALSTGNPAIKEKMELESKVAKLKLLRSNYQSQKFALEENVKVHLPEIIRIKEAKIHNIKIDIEMAQKHPLDEKSKFSDMVIQGVTYTDKSQAAEALMKVIYGSALNSDIYKIGRYRGFEIALTYDYIDTAIKMLLISQTTTYKFAVGEDKYGNIQRINNAISSLENEIIRLKQEVESSKEDLENSKKQLELPFPQEKEYIELNNRLIQLNKKLALEGSKGVENIA